MPLTKLQIDVLVLTAADGEDTALRAVNEGAIDDWLSPDPSKPLLSVRRFRKVDGGEIRVAHIHTHAMGETTAAIVATQYIKQLLPGALAMCGVCAGRPGWTQLGDVVIAEHLFKYDAGAALQLPGLPQHFQPEGQKRDLPKDWLSHAQILKTAFPKSEVGQKLAAERPYPPEIAELWLLDMLSRSEEPKFGQAIGLKPTSWRALVERLADQKQIRLADKLTIMAKGQKRLDRQLIVDPDPIAPPAWQIHVAPFGTGSALQRSAGIWDRLGDQSRLVRALDMEGAAIGEAGWHAAIEPTLVVKGVMDFAEPGRSQHVREFAAKAAAEVLLALLRQHLPHRGRTVDDVLLSGTNARPERSINPGALFHPRHQVIEFIDSVRAQELQQLEAWCSAETPACGRLFYGPGGTGKTRLMIEWSSRLRTTGWHAGFLPEDIPDADLDLVLQSSGPTLFIVDYAEARPNLIALMKKAASARPKVCGKLRVLLLAREVADWWKVLRSADTRIEDLFGGFAPTPVTVMPIVGPLRMRLFDAAFTTFARILQRSVPGVNPELADGRFGRALCVAMAALAAVEGRPIRAESILADTVARERHFWSRRFGRAESTIEATSEFEECMSRFMAAVTLRGGVSLGADAKGLLMRVNGPTEVQALKWLSSVYPLTGQPVKDEKFLGIAGIEPDLLGEQLVLEVLEHCDTPETFFKAVFDGCEPDDRATAFQVLGRLGGRGLDSVTPWIRRLVGDEPERIVTIALRSVAALRAETAHAPLGRILMQALEKHGGSVEIAVEIDRLLDGNEPSIALRELRLWATQFQLASLRESKSDADGTAEALLLNNLGNRLSDLGQHELALEAAQEAVKLYRGLVAARRDAFLPDLAMSLNNLGNRLSALVHLESALEAAKEAVDLGRGLVAVRRDAFLPDLAMSLNNLGNRLGALGHHESALEAAKEADELYRGLVAARRDAFLPDLAMSLNNLGNRLSALGQHESALEAVQYSVDIRRMLATALPDAFLLALTESLNNLGNSFSDLGQHELALEATLESLDIYLRLAASQPNSFLPDLARSLDNLGNSLGDLGQHELGLEAALESVEIRRMLTAVRRDAFQRDLAMSLNNLSCRLSAVGQRERAFEAARESVDIRRRLVAARPDAFLPDLAMSINNLGNRLSALGQNEPALKAAQEAVELYKRLVTVRRDAFLPSLAMSLNNLGNRLSTVGQHELALETTQNAVDIRRQLLAARPWTFLRDLAGSLNNLGNRLRALGYYESAHGSAQEAVELYRGLVADRRPDVLSDLANSLNNLGDTLSALGDHESALKATQESVGIRRNLVTAHPVDFLPNLAEKLTDPGDMVESVGVRLKMLLDLAKSLRLQPLYC